MRVGRAVCNRTTSERRRKAPFVFSAPTDWAIESEARRLRGPEVGRESRGREGEVGARRAAARDMLI